MSLFALKEQGAFRSTGPLLARHFPSEALSYIPARLRPTATLPPPGQSGCTASTTHTGVLQPYRKRVKEPMKVTRSVLLVAVVVVASMAAAAAHLTDTTFGVPLAQVLG